LLVGARNPSARAALSPNIADVNRFGVLDARAFKWKTHASWSL